MLSKLFAFSPLPPTPTVLIFVIASLALLRQYFLQRPLPGIPYNKETAGTLLGDIALMRRHPPDHRRDWLARHAQHLGSPVTQIFLEPFCKPWILVADFREAQDILLRRTREFDRAYRNQEQFSGVVPEHHITMKSSDPRFKGNKELVRDLMTPGFLNEVSAPQIHTKILMLVRLWELKANLSKGRPFPAAKDIWASALDIIMAVAFGLDDSKACIHFRIAHVGAHGLASGPAGTVFGAAGEDDQADTPVEFSERDIDPELQAFVTITESLAFTMKSPFPVAAHWLYRRTRKWREAARLKEQLVSREITRGVGILQAHRKDGDEPPEQRLRCAMDQILLREMGLAKKEGREPNLYSETIKDELVGYLVAGHDTSSTTIAWFTKFMTAHQDVQACLRDALRRGFPEAYAEGRQPAVGEILAATIPYLDAVVEETLRCSRTLPILVRQATCDTAVLGHYVPKGTNVIIVCHGPSYLAPALPVDESRRTEGCRASKARFGEWDPETVGDFVPERWIRTERDADTGEAEKEFFDPAAGPMHAFGGGPRGCFGRRLALLELRTSAALLVWNFQFCPLPGRLNDMVALDRLTSIPSQCFVKLRKI